MNAPAPAPPKLEDLLAGAKLVAGTGVSTVLADMDFETYSEAGYVWDEERQKWGHLPGASQKRKGLFVVGAAAYAEHPSTEVLSLAYNLKDGRGRQFWKPGLPNPAGLFLHIAKGLLIEAHNSGFEWWVWDRVCVPKYGWPPLPIDLLRCSMAKARAFALPGALGKAGEVLNLGVQKDKLGTHLLNKFSKPRNPTKKDDRLRIRPDEDDEGHLLYQYNLQDIATESELSSRVPDITGRELDFWLADQHINRRGCSVDMEGVSNCIAIVERALEKYNSELPALTGGLVTAASQVQRITGWLGGRGVPVLSLDEEGVSAALEGQLEPDCRRVLEIRQAVGSASVKKVFAMRLQATKASRLHDLFSYHAARTGRATGNGPQPQNLPNSGPDIFHCQSGAGGCGAYYHTGAAECPNCGMTNDLARSEEWNEGAAAFTLELLKCRSLELLEYFFRDALAAVSGCLRALFIAAEGADLICSDYSAIEAVVVAALSGEEWRLDVFRTHGKIYEASASMMFNVPLDEFTKHEKETGQYHPLRKKGKVAELAYGYQGWIGAAKAFGAPGEDSEIKQQILAWRKASPAIVEMWGGQHRGVPWDANRTAELYGLEGAAIAALLNPGTGYVYRQISYRVVRNALYCTLPSGRKLTYHHPRLSRSQRDPEEHSISYEGWNTNPANGAIGWVRLNTWGGRLFENVVQAVARDILAHAIVALERAGYPVVLHIHDEVVSEVPKDFGSVEEFEQILDTLPEWCKEWPIRAAGGWRGKRYRK